MSDAPVAGERSAHRDIDTPENFAEWPEDARVQFVRNTMQREGILRSLVDIAECDDREITQSLSKDQAAQVYLRLREMNDAE